MKITRGEAGGITNFGFAGGRVTDQTISVEGRLDRILASSLPHEVTHTIFAAYFGGPMPRWADEGASLLSARTPSSTAGMTGSSTTPSPAGATSRSAGSSASRIIPGT